MDQISQRRHSHSLDTCTKAKRRRALSVSGTRGGDRDDGVPSLKLLGEYR
jgi:hypothetical protein